MEAHLYWGLVGEYLHGGLGVRVCVNDSAFAAGVVDAALPGCGRVRPGVVWQRQAHQDPWRGARGAFTTLAWCRYQSAAGWTPRGGVYACERACPAAGWRQTRC